MRSITMYPLLLAARGICAACLVLLPVSALAQMPLPGSEEAELHFVTFHKTSMGVPPDTGWFQPSWTTEPFMVEWRVDFDKGFIHINLTDEEAGVSRIVRLFDSARKRVQDHGRGRLTIDYDFQMPSDMLLGMRIYVCEERECGKRVMIETSKNALPPLIGRDGLDYHTTYSVPVKKFPFDLFDFLDMAKDR